MSGDVSAPEPWSPGQWFDGHESVSIDEYRRVVAERDEAVDELEHVGRMRQETLRDAQEHADRADRYEGEQPESETASPNAWLVDIPGRDKPKGSRWLAREVAFTEQKRDELLVRYPNATAIPLYDQSAAGVQSTTETATGHDYSLIDAVLPAKGKRRAELIGVMRGAWMDADDVLGGFRSAYDALRESAVSSESEGNA